MKKKLMMLTLSVVMAAMLVAGCGKDAEIVTEETSVEVTETESAASDNVEDAEQETETAEEDPITDEEESDAVSVDAEESAVSSEDTKENDTTESSDTTETAENADDGSEVVGGEYTAEIIAASIPNNHVKMTITTEGFGMGVSICDENAAITMDLGVSVMEIYSVDQMTYLHGVYEGQDMWSKASGAENLTESYSEDTEEGMQAGNIHNVSAAVKETKNGKEYDVVTANVDNEAEDGTITANQYSFYIDPQTLQTEYMIYEEEGMVYETKIETIASIELPEGAAGAQEIGAEELAMQMLGFMFAGYEE